MLSACLAAAARYMRASPASPRQPVASFHMDASRLADNADDQAQYGLLNFDDHEVASRYIAAAQVKALAAIAMAVDRLAAATKDRQR
jgi:hypothetical protein